MYIELESMYVHRTGEYVCSYIELETIDECPKSLSSD